MDAVFPGIAKGFDLFRLAGHVVGLAVLHVPASGGPLEIAVELDAVGRVHIDALHLAAQAFALGQTGHDLQGVAQYHAVGPVLVVLVKIGLVRIRRNAVKIRKQRKLLLRLGPSGLGLAYQLLHQGAGMDLFLNVQGRGLHGKAVIPIVFAAPDELRVQIRVAFLEAQTHGGQLFLPHDGLILRRGDVGAPVGLMGDGLNGLEGRSFASHAVSFLTRYLQR